MSGGGCCISIKQQKKQQVISTMPQPWYGHHGPAATAAHSSQNLAGTMQYHRYQHGAPGAPVADASGFSSHRSSPAVGRPPSSASTSSSASYPVATGPAPESQGSAHASNHYHHQHQGGPMPMANGQHPHASHQGPQHGYPHQHSTMHHHMPTARYPMPPRNSGGPQVRLVTTGFMPAKGQNGELGQPLRQLSNGNTQPHELQGGSGGALNAHSHFGPAKPSPPSNMAQAQNGGHAPMHHPVPYRHHPRAHGMGGHPHPHQYQHQRPQFYHHQGYQHNPRQQSYPPAPPHHNSMDSQQQHEAKYTHYQRPMYDSPQTVVTSTSSSRSPSPPPAPPTGQESKTPLISAPAAPGSYSVASAPSTQSQEDKSAPTKTAEKKPLNERTQIETGDSKPERVEGVSKSPVNEDDDAASILLQLSGIPSQACDQAASGDDAQENRPMSTIQTEETSSFTSHSKCTYLKPIEAASSIEEDATIATVEGTDYAPDLTSEPSSDSIDKPHSDFPAPIPDNYPTRLALPYDDSKLNSLHCFLRSELLEIFVVQMSSHKSPTHSPGSSVGRVGLRCVHCAMARRIREDRDEAPMAVFYPKSVAEIYRLVTSWQRCHLRKCKSLPPPVRSQWQALRENDKSRGKTHYWITSGKEIGLIDCQSRAGGVRFGPNTKGTVTEKTKPVPSKAPETRSVPISETEKQSASTTATPMETTTSAPTV